MWSVAVRWFDNWVRDKTWCRWLPIGLPALFILLVSGIWFGPMLIEGKVPIPIDGLIGSYYPWLDDKWGYAAGVPVQNISVTDAFS